LAQLELENAQQKANDQKIISSLQEEIKIHKGKISHAGRDLSETTANYAMMQASLTKRTEELEELKNKLNTK
jgi:hypothetical protein